MEPNISQISRWWVAYSILSRGVDILLFIRTSDSIHDDQTVPSVHMTSYPYDLCLSPPTNHTQSSANYVLTPKNFPMRVNHSLPATTDLPDEVIPLSPQTHSQPIPSNNLTTCMLTHKGQQSINKWFVHRPFISNISLDSSNPMPGHPSTPSQIFLDHLTPFGNPISVVDHTKMLRVCMQNPQHDFRLYGDGIEITSISNQLHSLGVNLFVLISPNVNWLNPSSWARTHQLFRPNFLQVNMSAVSSNIGLDLLYLHTNLIGGAAILTFGLWSSKVSNTFHDESGFGSYTVTTIKGKDKKYVSYGHS